MNAASFPLRRTAKPASRLLARLRRAGAVGLVCCLVIVAWPGHLSAGTLVQLTFANLGSVDIDLFDDLVPTTVDNFLQYVNSSAYSDTIIHRVDAGLPTSLDILQGGGYDTGGAPLTTSPAIPLQYSRANTRGTIAMARTGDPTTTTTATSQWFINAQDNTTNLGQANGGGYAVFGWVVGPGMSVVDSIVNLPTYDLTGGNPNSPFNEVPLQGYTQQDYNNGVDPTPNLVVLTGVTVLEAHPSFQNPWNLADVDNDGVVIPKDALTVINDLLTNGSHALTGPFTGTNYLDTNGDGSVTPLDALRVINALLEAGSPTASPQAMSLSMLVVPEPSSLTLAVVALLALGGCAMRRRHRRHGPLLG